MRSSMNFRTSLHIKRASLDMIYVERIVNLANSQNLAEKCEWNVQIYQKNRGGFVAANHLEDDSSGEGLWLKADSQRDGALKKIYFYRDIPIPGGPGVQRDSIVFDFVPEFPGNKGPYVLLDFRCEVASLAAYDLFIELMKVSCEDFCWFLPEYHGPWGRAKTYLEAALQRDYEWGGLDSRIHPEQIAFAKAIARVLPRIGFEYYPPNYKLPLLPQRLGWLNCWSPEVAEHLGFPDAQKDADLLPLCHQLPSGHWIVRLTEDPLDLTRPEHVEAIVRAYWRFDKIGRRANPAAKKANKAKTKPVPIDPASLSTYLIHERDESGNWWQSDYPPVEAASEEDALRIYFCKLSRSRMPRPHETVNRLRKAYDAVALEVGGMPRSEEVEARLKEQG
jgi:hypothetical protein